MSDLTDKITKIETQLKLMNNGQMPEAPKPLHEQLRTLMISQGQPAPEMLSALNLTTSKTTPKPLPNSGEAPPNSNSGGVSRKSASQIYMTQMHMADVKQIREQTDPVSALVHLCKAAFQLEPQFSFVDQDQTVTQSRNKFRAIVRLHQTDVAACAGQSKAEAKKKASKLTLHLVSPNIYKELIVDEPIPKNLLDSDPPSTTLGGQDSSSSQKATAVSATTTTNPTQ